ncbi:Alkaline phosphatase, tissue-nonspecific isozyme [Nymphon striatum]|nr:Alkaline phosphatase, tissue-nonspecific isozyme [Nymphon striatum]
MSSHVYCSTPQLTDILQLRHVYLSKRHFLTASKQLISWFSANISITTHQILVIFSESNFFIVIFLINKTCRNYWRRQGHEALKETLNLKHNMNVAKNVIVFMGDGMDVSTVTATRIYKGQKNHRSGEEEHLIWDKFPHVAMLKTYSLDRQVPDSSCAATAYLCGVKANFKTVGVDGRVKFNDCKSSIGASVDSIATWSIAEGKDAGIIATSRVTDSSPGATFGHSASKKWESDASIPISERRCKDMARQLVEDYPGRKFKVILGGGRGNFLPNSTFDVEANSSNFRQDSRNLINLWKNDKKSKNLTYAYVKNLQELKKVNSTSTDYLLGLFAHRNMDYELDHKKKGNTQPSLPEMTEKAISILSKNSRGYFLFVEGSRIDHAHHFNHAAQALEETYQLERALKVALKMTNLNETLIIVTADHGHGMTITGNPKRGNPILGSIFSVFIVVTKYILYLIENKDFMMPAGFPRTGSKHGGQDVQAFAIGPMSHLFHGTQEQTYLAYAMAYASCVGANKDHCMDHGSNRNESKRG